MLHTKFQGHRPFGSGEEDCLRFSRGVDNPRGQNSDVNRKALSLYPFVASFKKRSLKSAFIVFFFMI